VRGGTDFKTSVEEGGRRWHQRVHEERGGGKPIVRFQRRTDQNKAQPHLGGGKSADESEERGGRKDVGRDHVLASNEREAVQKQKKEGQGQHPTTKIKGAAPSGGKDVITARKNARRETAAPSSWRKNLRM